MKVKSAIFFAVCGLILNSSPSFSLIQPDDNSVDLAIKYGIKTKGNSTTYILGTNWVQDNTGAILNIYSPFIQIAVKSGNQNITGNIDEDVKIIKEKLKNTISAIKTKNEVRFILSFCGDSPYFSQKYKAYIIDINTSNKAKIKPKKTSQQKEADKDGFNPEHPYSAVNCYIFKFDDISKLKEYYFIVASEDGKEIKYKLNNSEIF